MIFKCAQCESNDFTYAHNLDGETLKVCRKCLSTEPLESGDRIPNIPPLESPKPDPIWSYVEAMLPLVHSLLNRRHHDPRKSLTFKLVLEFNPGDKDD